MTTLEIPRIEVTVDVVLFTLKNEELHVVLSRRSKEPFKSQLALPGGYIHAQEDRDSAAAAARVLSAKAGLAAPYLEQLYTHADGVRDPRGWSVSISYYALVPLELFEAASGGSEPLELHPLAAVVGDASKLTLAFDHKRIVAVAIERLRSKSSYSTLPLYLLGQRFTLTDAQHVYWKALGFKPETANFRRWLLALDVLQPIRGAKKEGPHRAAQFFKLKRDFKLALLKRTLNPPDSVEEPKPKVTTKPRARKKPAKASPG